MSNQQSAPNLMLSRDNTKRDSTRILSNLSSDRRAVHGRAKNASSRNKILTSLTVPLALVGATIWLIQPPATMPSFLTRAVTTHIDTPTQTVPDTTALALPTVPEPQAAQIENIPATIDDASKNGMASSITTPLKPFTALTESTIQPKKTNNTKLIEKTAKADQIRIVKNVTKNGTNGRHGTSASRLKKNDEDTDVALLAALLQSTGPRPSTKKSAQKKYLLLQNDLKEANN